MQSEKELFEWKSDKMLEYHKRQIKNPYRSTIHFENFLLENINMEENRILDIACGAGGVTNYIANRHKDCSFCGIDIEDFSDYFKNCENVKFQIGDIYNLDCNLKNKFNGVFLTQTLSWIPNYKTAIEQVCGLKADWIALSLLGYEGKINFNIAIENYERLDENNNFTSSYYNIYSIPLLKELFAKLGYSEFIFKKFEMDIDIEKPNHLDMGTYTIQTKDEDRLQVSGALLMPWYFILVKK